MSIEPAEAVLDGVIDGEVLADAVESWLDAHPLPVDEQEVDRATERLAARLGRPARSADGSRGPAGRRVWPWIAAVALAAGLLAVLGSRPTPVPVPHEGPPPPVALRITVAEDPIAVQGVEVPARLELVAARRTVDVAPGARLLASERGRVGAMLVQHGAIAVDGRPVGRGSWAVLTRADDGTPHDVVFPDGTAPPPMPADVWGTEVTDQLRALRWASLPDATLSTLDTLLEAP